MSPKLYTTGNNGEVEQWKITTMMTNTTMTTNGLISEYVYGSGMAPVDGSIMAPMEGSVVGPMEISTEMQVSRGYKVLDGVGECMESCWDGICSEGYGWDIPWEKQVGRGVP